MMKTALIYNDTEELLYAVVDGDWSEFQGVYINDSLQDPEVCDELNARLFYDDGKPRIKFCHIDEFAQAIREGATVVEVGFLL